MRLTVLGSGNSEPQPDRACAGNLLETPDPILLDMGPGTWRNLARTGVAPDRVGLVLLSHLHVDHISDILPLFFHPAPDRSLVVAGPPGTRAAIEGIRRVVPRLDREDLRVEVREMSGGELVHGGARCFPIPVPHVATLESVAWRVEAGGRRFVYSGDCANAPATGGALEGADLALVEATFPDRPHPAHLTLSEACALAKGAGVRKLVLTHLSPAWRGRDVAAEAAERFGGEVREAKDLLSLDV